MTRKQTACSAGLLIVLAVAAGCWAPSRREVVVYAALDREFSEPVLNEFQQRTGLAVRAQYDVESTKTVGLVRRIIQEQHRPVCDVFWNNEILHTLRLERLGLLAAYQAPNAGDFRASYRSPTGHWHGLAARARVLLVNTQLVPAGELPDSIEDLADSKWRDRVGIAKPLFGTTATHAAVLFAAWGETRAQEFFQSLKGQARILSGNKQVAISVGRGQLAFGLTDTDDAIIEVEQGQPVAIVFPDQQESGIGTLFIPNTVAILRGGPHEQNAQQLIDFLLSPAVEQRLAQGPSAQIPLNHTVQEQPRILPDQPIRWMDVDFAAAADAWEPAEAFLRDLFAAAD